MDWGIVTAACSGHGAKFAPVTGQIAVELACRGNPPDTRSAGPAAAAAGAVGNPEPATGATQALTEHWDGTAWSVVPSPTPLESILNGVAAASTSDVWAAGSFLNSASVEQALFEHWNGRKWV